MPLRKFHKSHCSECGHPRVGRIEDDKIWLDGCKCPPAPGPAPYPVRVDLQDIIWPGQQDARAAGVREGLGKALEILNLHHGRTHSGIRKICLIMLKNDIKVLIEATGEVPSADEA